MLLHSLTDYVRSSKYASWKRGIRFDVAQLVLEKTSFRDLLSPLIMSTKQFCMAFTNALKLEGGFKTQEKELEMLWTSDPSSVTSQASAKKKRVSAGGKAADSVDLPSPSKQTKSKATGIDQKIDSRYIGKIKSSVLQVAFN